MVKLFSFKKAKFILSLIGGYILFLVMKKAGWNNLTNVFYALTPLFFCLSILCWILNLVLGALRFRSVLSVNLSFLEILEIYLFGALLNYAAPIQGLGIGTRIGMLKFKQISILKSSAGIGSEVIYDIGFSILISIVGLTILGKTIIKDFIKATNWNSLLIPVILVLLLVISIYLFKKEVFIKNFIRNILKSFSLHNLYKNSIITLAMYAASVMMAYFLYKSANLKVNPFLLLFATRSAYLIGLLSLIPGGLGVRDSVFGYVCSLSGIPLNIALSISVILRFMAILTVVFMIGILNLFTILKSKIIYK